MIQFANINKKFGKTQALDDVSLSINRGEFVVIVGSSGAGKSTLLRLINGLAQPESGQLTVFNQQPNKLNGSSMRKFRRTIGLIFQDFNLIERSTVITNVLTGRLGYNTSWKTLLGIFTEQDIHLAKDCLKRVALEHKTFQKAGQLSGGEKQRVSIARALAQQPQLILADEPVASLDPPTAHDIMQYFKRINEEEGITVLVNLHDIMLACQYGKRIIGMRDGRIVHDGPVNAVDTQTFTNIYGRNPHHHEMRVMGYGK